MKNTLLMITVLVVGCATTPTMKSVAGTYEFKEGQIRQITRRYVLLENGDFAAYENDKGGEGGAKWKIVNGEIHIVSFSSRSTTVYSINKDGSITPTADISWPSGRESDGYRTEAEREIQDTWIKIK